MKLWSKINFKMMNITAAENFIMDGFSTKLPENLFYHGLHHTLDIMKAALELAKQEGITDDASLALLKTAALYHDSGFLNTYQNHEEEGCKIVKNILPEFDYSNKEIEIICGMIMATKIPQNPKTHLEEILCDADLDYLGREDFDPIAETLYQELKERNLISGHDAWNAVQINFFKSHQYWTDSARKNRNGLKQRHLDNLTANFDDH